MRAGFPSSPSGERARNYRALMIASRGVRAARPARRDRGSDVFSRER